MDLGKSVIAATASLKTLNHNAMIDKSVKRNVSLRHFVAEDELSMS